MFTFTGHHPRTGPARDRPLRDFHPERTALRAPSPLAPTRTESVGPWVRSYVPCAPPTPCAPTRPACGPPGRLARPARPIRPPGQSLAAGPRPTRQSGSAR
jgi:hypothetical protein